MTAFEEDNEIEVITRDNVILNLNLKDINFFSKYPDSTLWLVFKEDGLSNLLNFIYTYITRKNFEAIIYFYNYDRWPFSIKIINIFDPYSFLNLPTFDDCNSSEDEYIENSSDGY